jgi:hypothetical protein
MRRPQVMFTFDFTYIIVLTLSFTLNSFLRLSVSEGKPYKYSLEKLNMFFYTVVKKLRRSFRFKVLSFKPWCFG